MIDTHCHLTFPELASRVPEVLEEGRRHGVTGCVTISTTTRDAAEALAVARAHEGVWCSAGVHPLYADQGPHDWALLGQVAADPRCVAWGELGLDRHYPDPPEALQRAVLDEQLSFIASTHARWRDTGGSESAGRLSLPIVVHCREAFAELVPVLRRSGLDAARMVFHCFTGDAADARLVLDLGAMISFTGVVTYRNAQAVREAARLVPIDRIMVETDAPFLSPEPKRGVRPCEPWMVSLTARRLAELRNEPWDDFHSAINQNTRRFFGIG